MKKKILIVGDSSDYGWVEMLKNVLSPFGVLSLATQENVWNKLKRTSYQLIIVDVSYAKKPLDLVSRIHREESGASIVVATNSPTWRRAKEYILAGAADYIRKSTDPSTAHDVFVSILRSIEK